MFGVSSTYLDELGEWLRIPSVSADEAHREDVRRAADWLCSFVRAAGGNCDVVDWHGRPLVIGELRASAVAAQAPTVLVYGHFDVQPPAPLDLWESPPFEPTLRDGSLYARGVADDKGQLYLLLKAAALLAGRGELPVNVRIASDGEEEVGGSSIVEFLAGDDRGADVALIFDSPMVRRDLPAFVIATRGIVYMHVRVRTGERDLHSGLYGGAALNALHALVQALSGVLPRGGRLPEPLRLGVVPPLDEELAAWGALAPGSAELAGQGGRPADDRAAEEFYLRTWSEPALDLNGIEGGEPRLQKTVLPVVADANLSIRLAPGQDADTIARNVERLLRESAPPGAEVEIEVWASSPPGLVRPDHQAIELARAAFEEAFGVRPLLLRSGGTLPIMAALADRDIPAVLTGFALPESNIHAPNERLPLEYVEKGVEIAAALYRAFAALG